MANHAEGSHTVKLIAAVYVVNHCHAAMNANKHAEHSHASVGFVTIRLRTTPAQKRDLHYQCSSLIAPILHNGSILLREAYVMTTGPAIARSHAKARTPRLSTTDKLLSRINPIRLHWSLCMKARRCQALVLVSIHVRRLPEFLMVDEMLHPATKRQNLLLSRAS